MLQPRSFNRLQLGPVVGHTDQESSRIWIQVFDQPEHYTLRVMGVGLFRFESTEPPLQQEFGTAIALISGLRSDHIYQYQIYRHDRFIPRTRGQFRTMPDPGSMADILFNVISCNSLEEDGMWPRFEEYVKDSSPHFILMVGDQVYIDDDEPDVFKEHLRSSADIRREALAEKYRLNWSREPVQRVLANVPTYMTWDDHDIHDGFGSSPQNSETLLSLHPKGQQAFEVFDAFYRDCRDVYWHFQACHNPQPQDNVAVAPGNYFRGPPQGRRRAMPFVFRCGRLVVLVLDSRGERDVFREKYPILGGEQWQFINEVFANLDADVEALAVVTPTPIASMDPQGQTQKIMGRRTDDIELFKKGDLEGIINLKGSSDIGQLGLAIVNSHLSRLKGEPQNLGNFQLGLIDEARDQWSHHLSQPEQIALIKSAGQARLSNRIPGNPRSLLFLSGDIHVGGIFDIVSKNPDFKAPCIVSSGISKTLGDPTGSPVFGSVIDEDFEITPGIRSSLRHVVNSFNFGIINVIPTGSGAKVLGTIAHEETSFAFGIDITDLL